MSNNQNSNGQGLGSAIYKGASELGTFKTDLTMICGVIFGLIMVVVGLYFIFANSDNKFLRLEGKITSANCDRDTIYDKYGNPSTTYECIITVGYSIDGKNYLKQIPVHSSHSYVKDQTIELSVSKSDHSKAEISGLKQSTWGWISLCGALVLVGLSYLNYYMAHKYKLYAAAQGADTVFDVFS